MTFFPWQAACPRATALAKGRLKRLFLGASAWLPCLAFCALLLQALPAAAQPAPRQWPTTPIEKPDGKPWRIGYFESGDYDNYPQNLKTIAEALADLGWVEFPSPIPANLSGEQLWQWLSRHAKSRYLQFPANAYWSDRFDPKQRSLVRSSIARRIHGHGDIDLILAMGTWAGQDMVALGAPAPTIVVSVSDPVGSGIIASPEDSGLDNLNCRVSPQRYRKQIHLFHEIIPFKRLGMIYENTTEGRTYAAVDDVEAEARASGFSVDLCEAPFSGIDQKQIQQNALSCYKKLANSVDAMYITVHRGTDGDAIRPVAQLLREKHIPSFSMRGPGEVKEGILMSMAQDSYADIGMFHAKAIARIFHGAKPRELSQIWSDPPSIVLNFQTMREIGFDPPVDVLLAVDTLYGMPKKNSVHASE
jgi:ABC-type uncharacterized transport system substrate-binding protein